jgi:hypothetical protein
MTAFSRLRCGHQGRPSASHIIVGMLLLSDSTTPRSRGSQDRKFNSTLPLLSIIVDRVLKSKKPEYVRSACNCKEKTITDEGFS